MATTTSASRSVCSTRTRQIPVRPACTTRRLRAMASSPPTTTAPSWTSLQEQASVTLEGTRIKDQISLRSQGLGTPHVANKLRLQDASDESEIRLTLYRDHAGWCPYCQKVWALIEEKKIPCRIERINMRSYGPKPKWCKSTKSNCAWRISNSSLTAQHTKHTSHRQGSGWSASRDRTRRQSRHRVARHHAAS